MKIGTKSVLWGCHQFLWHPFTVWRAWCHLYGKTPDWKETIAIICHDLGYWGCENIDGLEGKEHPSMGARIAARIVRFFSGRGFETYIFTACHSRDYAARIGHEPSALYAADKASIFFDPPGFYLLRARLSGEIHEFVSHAVANGHLPEGTTDREWLNFFREKIRTRPGVAELL